MTVLRSLRSRILLARVAVQLPLAEAGDRLPGLATRGIDMAVLTTRGSAERAAGPDILRDLERHFGRRVLLAIDTPEIDADVRVLFPGERDRSRPHQWALLGQVVQDQGQIITPDGAFQFLTVPGTPPGSPLLRAAMANHPPLRQDSVPWFATAGLDAGAVQVLVSSGVRRVWLTRNGTMEGLERIGEILRRAWREDPDYEDYLGFAVQE